MHKLVMIFVYSKSYRVSKADKFMLAVVFIPAGPIRLLANVIVDTYAFVKHCLMTELKKVCCANKARPFTKESLNLLNKYIHERQERIMPFRQVAGEARDRMGVLQQISKILQPWGLVNFISGPARIMRRAVDPQPDANFDQMFAKVKEYSSLKLILEGNSEFVVHNKRRIKSIDCKLLSALVEDALRAKTVEKLSDDNFIFIRRAVDKKERARIQER